MRLENDSGAGHARSRRPRNMTRFVDSGEYMFHRNLFKVSARPNQIRVTGLAGTTVDGQTTGTVSDWLRDVTPLTADPNYKWNFVDEYKHPQQVYARFEEIAQQYPDIAEIVALPNKTNGYQRKAMATIGSTATANQPSAVVVHSAAWGHEGGNGITVEMVNRPGADLPLQVEVNGRAVRVLLAKNAAGALASTATQVAAAIEAGSQGLIDRAHSVPQLNAGTGIVPATTAPIVLTDFLTKRAGAPAGEVPRGPYTVRALRIGKFRDGSKPGVLIQANDHAREWVPITITLETAERLVRNYADDPATKDIVENTDLFLIPSNNPDGANYSFFNFASQRRNMTNHCPDNNADPGRRDAWGVDLNRNYSVASGFDGYDGASTSCIDDTFQGPAELSEPESKNIIWLAQNNRNIKFMMSVHSNGGQLFWQPGAYIADGRITTPRPPMGHEAFYWQSADRILSQVRASRQTVVTPENVGGSSDVLYSSRRQRPRGAVLQLRRVRVRLGGRRLGLQPGHRQLPGRLVPARVGRQPGPRQRPQRDDGVRERRDGDVPDRQRLRQGQDRGDVDAVAGQRHPVGLADRGAGSTPTSRRPSTTRPTAAGRRSSRRATSRSSSANPARRCGSTGPRRSSGSRSTPPATSRTTTTRPTRRRRTTTAARRSRSART